MLSRLKKINPDLSASSIALVIAILSVFIALGSDNAPCLSAIATCTVRQNQNLLEILILNQTPFITLQSGII